MRRVDVNIIEREGRMMNPGRNPRRREYGKQRRSNIQKEFS